MQRSGGCKVHSKIHCHLLLQCLWDEMRIIPARFLLSLLILMCIKMCHLVVYSFVHFFHNENRDKKNHCESSSLQRQYYHERTLVDSDAQTVFLKHTLICLGVYKWLLYTKISPQYWNAPWGVTGSLLTAWSDLVWFANGWKWDCCLQANK